MSLKISSDELNSSVSLRTVTLGLESFIFFFSFIICMTITGTIKTRATATRYPVTSGLTAETTKTEGRKSNLVAQKGSTVARRRKVGL